VHCVFFSTFQLKKMGALVAQFGEGAPVQLAERTEDALRALPEEAAYELERLVAETLDVVERAMPDVDTAQVRRQLGRRDEPWSL